MGKLFGNKTAMPQLDERQVLETQYKNGRNHLLLVAIFTAINLVLHITQANVYFLFSACIPFLLTDLGMLLCGKYPAEAYTGGLEDIEFFDDVVLVVLFAISLVLVLFYLLSWIFSNKHRVGWMIFGLVYFATDTLLMLVLNGFALSSLLDIVFHGLVIFSLTRGIVAHYKLKKLPPEEACAPAGEEPRFDGTAETVEVAQTEE